MHISIKVVSSNLAHGEVYSIQHYEINFTQVSSTNKTDCRDITESGVKRYSPNPNPS